MGGFAYGVYAGSLGEGVVCFILQKRPAVTRTTPGRRKSQLAYKESILASIGGEEPSQRADAVAY
jgi:hypothetical protein